MKAVVEGAQAGTTAAGDPMTGAAPHACVAAPFKGALDAATGIKANVSVSVNVQASASRQRQRKRERQRQGRLTSTPLETARPAGPPRRIAGRRDPVRVYGDEHGADAAGLGDLAGEVAALEPARRCGRRARLPRSRRTTPRASGSSPW